MTSSDRPWIVRNAIAVALAITVIVVIALAAIRFPSVLWILVGFVIGLIAVATWRAIRQPRLRPPLLLGALVLIAIVGLVTFQGLALHLTKSSVSSCSLLVKPLDMAAGTFRLEPSAEFGKDFMDPALSAAGFQPQPIALPGETLHSTSDGLMTRLVDIPLPAGSVVLTSPGGATRNVDVTLSSCERLALHLRNFPAGSFYQADNPEETPVPHPFGSIENTSWTVLSSGDPSVRFTYVPAPFSGFRTTLQPLIGLYSAGPLLDGVLGLLLSRIPWLKVGGWIWDRIKAWWSKTRPPATTPATPHPTIPGARDED